jgi:hypothetical protein
MLASCRINSHRVVTPKIDSCQIRGSVIETVEMGGKTVVRLLITGGSLDVLSEPGCAFHLGDSVVLNGEFRPCSVKHALDKESHLPVMDADFLS